MSVRTTVLLDEQLVARLRDLVPRRGLSRFINRAIEEKVEEIERARIEEAMKEGYLKTRTDRAALNDDWQVVDVEDWPE